VIRKAISCDICGTEMLSANHWFVARETGTELRISIWNGRNQIRGSCRHLCGHKCLHKLLDDFTARASRSCPAQIETRVSTQEHPQRTDSSPTSPASLPPPRLPVIRSRTMESESSAHLLTPPQPFHLERTSLHKVCAEAWKRERDRQQKNIDHRSIA
jgi:hypothetical protein